MSGGQPQLGGADRPPELTGAGREPSGGQESEAPAGSANADPGGSGGRSGSGGSGKPSGPESPKAEGNPELTDEYEEFADEDFVHGMADPRGGTWSGGGPRLVTYNVHGGNVNAGGTVFGGQGVRNGGGPDGQGAPRVEVQEGPIPSTEIMDATSGFAEPDWFPEAMRKLDTGVLFLTGEQGTGRRTAALNLLHRHSSWSMDLRAVDSDVNLADWKPAPSGARGYLVDGLLPLQNLKPGLMNALRRKLSDANARMVIVMPDDPHIVRSLARDLHVSPVKCQPPPPRAVFDERLKVEIGDPAKRARLLASLPPGALDELLPPTLLPAQVTELVTRMAEAVRNGADPDLNEIRDRLSFLAKDEVPDLLRDLYDDADGLAFLLVVCVFEGLDHRIVRDEAERLLTLAEGRLNSVIVDNRPGSTDDQSGGKPQPPRPNPQFVFRRSLDELLRMVRARCEPREIRTGSGFSYAVEPVRFTRHGQGEAVLSHVWREYGQLSGLLSEWLGDIPARDRELAGHAGRVMGLEATWGGGRRALQHIAKLAESKQANSRIVAAAALSLAAEDPVLAGEVKYLLRKWSWRKERTLRSTVAYTCETNFGASRPDQALTLLRHAYRGTDGEEWHLGLAIQRSLLSLYFSGSARTVFRRLVEWSEHEGPDRELALETFPELLSSPWISEQLVTDGEFKQQVIHLIRRTLKDPAYFDATSHSLIFWCLLARGEEDQQAAIQTLFSALAQDMDHSVFRLFVQVDRESRDTPLPGHDIARTALSAWRNGTLRRATPADRPQGSSTT